MMGPCDSRKSLTLTTHLPPRPHPCLLLLSPARSTRKLGLEFLQSLAQSAGATVRKVPVLVEHIMSLCLRFMRDVDDDAKWVTRDDDQGTFTGDAPETEEGELCSAGCANMDRLAHAIGGKVLLPLFQRHWATLSVSADWKDRRAIIVSLALILEGCKKVLAPQIRSYVELVAKFTADPHPRVRAASVRCLAQMATDFSDPSDLSGEAEGIGQMAETIAGKNRGGGAGGAGASSSGSGASLARARAEKYQPKPIQDVAGDLLVGALVRVAGSTDVPRVRGVAAAALINVLDPAYASSETIGTSTPAILAAMFNVLQTVPETYKLPRAAALQVISNCAAVLEDDFLPYYQGVMGPLRAVLGSTPATPQQAWVRLRAVEAFSTVCEAVGKETSGEDAVRCLQMVMQQITTAASGTDSEDEQAFRIAATALVRIASTLGADFTPFFPATFQILGSKASQDVAFTVTDADETPGASGAGADDDEDNVGSGVTEQIINVAGQGRRKVALDTHAKEEKLSALTCLVQLLMDLGVDVPSFHPAIDIIADVVLKPSPFADIRMIASEALLPLIRAALADTADRAHGQRILERIIPYLTDAMPREMNLECLYNLADAACEVTGLAWQSTTQRYNGPADVDGQAAAGVSPDGKPASPPSGSPGAPAGAGSPAGTGGSPGSGSAGAGAAAGAPSKYGRAVMKLEQLPAFFEMVQTIYEGSAVRRQAQAENIQANPDADEEDRDALAQALEGEDQLITNLTDAVVSGREGGGGKRNPRTLYHSRSTLTPSVTAPSFLLRAGLLHQVPRPRDPRSPRRRPHWRTRQLPHRLAEQEGGHRRPHARGGRLPPRRPLRVREPAGAWEMGVGLPAADPPVRPLTSSPSHPVPPPPPPKPAVARPLPAVHPPHPGGHGPPQHPPAAALRLRRGRAHHARRRRPHPPHSRNRPPPPRRRHRPGRARRRRRALDRQRHLVAPEDRQVPPRVCGRGDDHERRRRLPAAQGRPHRGPPRPRMDDPRPRVQRPALARPGGLARPRRPARHRQGPAAAPDQHGREGGRGRGGGRGGVRRGGAL
jgi:hypothetical protein